MKYIVLCLLLIFNTHAQRVRDFFVEVGRGQYYGMESNNKFGKSDGIGTTEEDIWDGGVLYTGRITDSSLVSVVSTSTADDSGSTGAWIVEMTGIDGSLDWAIQKDTVVMNGTTAVSTSKYFRRIYTARVLIDGNTSVSGSNTGTITFESVGGGEDMAIISTNNGRTLMSPFTCPGTHICYITDLHFTSGRDREVEYKLRTSGNDGIEPSSWSNRLDITLDGQPFNLPYPYMIKLQPKTDVTITGKNLQNGSVGASVIYNILMERLIP